MRCVRIWFEKKGDVRFISHLDLMRTMTRAIRRSQIPLWYTEGFNPHPYMTFVLPLSLGMESENDAMDIRVEGEITNREVMAALSKVMPQGITVTCVTEPVLDPKFIAFASFDIAFYTAESAAALEERIRNMLSGNELVVQKLGKKGHRKVYKDIDLLPHIKTYELKEKDGAPVLSLVLPAGSTTNINPSLLADEIIKGGSEDDYYVIKRKQLFAEGMKAFE